MRVWRVRNWERSFMEVVVEDDVRREVVSEEPSSRGDESREE